MTGHRVFAMSFASVCPHYVTKAEKKGRSQAEVDEVIRWLTDYSQAQLEGKLEAKADFKNLLSGRSSP